MIKKFKFFLSLPMQLLIVLMAAFLFGDMIPLEYKRFAYTLSLQIQEVLVLVLPFVIFSYMFACLVSFENNIIVFLLALLGAVVFSSVISLLYAYGVAQVCFSYVAEVRPFESLASPLLPFDFFHLYHFPNKYALLLGVVLGVFFFYFHNPKVTALAHALRQKVTWGLKVLFIPLLPVFIFGFIVKMQHEGVLLQVVKSYGPIVVVALLAQLVYVSLFFFVAAGFKVDRFATYLSNAFPSMVTAFTTMSSALSLPLVLEGAEKSSRHPKLVQTCVPATINIHTVGDSIVIPLLVFATLLTFNHSVPAFATYIAFAGYLTLQRFSGATIPGGGAMLAMPILGDVLGFDPVMKGFFMALYVFFDPFITVGNVSANGALAVLFSNLFGKKMGLSETSCKKN